MVQKSGPRRRHQVKVLLLKDERVALAAAAEGEGMPAALLARRLITDGLARRALANVTTDGGKPDGRSA